MYGIGGEPVLNMSDTWYKLAKAQKERTSPGSLGFKKFGPVKLLVGKVCAQIFCNFFFSPNWIVLGKFIFYFLSFFYWSCLYCLVLEL